MSVSVTPLGENVHMAFGQPVGPPASAQKIKQLLELLNAAGHTDFRDARGPMGFNQRQAGGRFTRQEVDDYIEQLETQAHDRANNIAPVAKMVIPKLTQTDKSLRSLSDSVLAAELQRRGWIVVEP